MIASSEVLMPHELVHRQCFPIRSVEYCCLNLSELTFISNSDISQIVSKLEQPMARMFASHGKCWLPIMVCFKAVQMVHKGEGWLLYGSLLFGEMNTTCRAGGYMKCLGYFWS